MKKFLYIFFLSTIFILSSCSKEEDPVEGAVKRTTIVYMMAENSLSGTALNDIGEMIEGSKSLPRDYNIVVYVDDAWLVEESMPRLYEIRNGECREVMTFPEQDSCDGEVFEGVMKEITTRFEAESYSLVMWSHGTGWLPAKKGPNKTIGVDNNKNTTANEGSEMEITAMREALEHRGLHLDWIMFDACFMQCIETAYELKDLTDYIIGSPAEIPSAGAPYEKIVPYFAIAVNELSATEIAKSYYDYYKNYAGALLSVIKTSELENLAHATAICFDEIPTVDDAEGIQAYGPWSEITGWNTEYYDMASIMWHKTDASAYEQWRERLEAAVPVRLQTSSWRTVYGFEFEAVMTDPEHYAGVSMFLPAERYEEKGYNEKWKETRWGKRLTPA